MNRTRAVRWPVLFETHRATQEKCSSKISQIHFEFQLKKETNRIKMFASSGKVGIESKFSGLTTVRRYSSSNTILHSVLVRARHVYLRHRHRRSKYSLALRGLFPKWQCVRRSRINRNEMNEFRDKIKMGFLPFSWRTRCVCVCVCALRHAWTLPAN